MAYYCGITLSILRERIFFPLKEILRKLVIWHFSEVAKSFHKNRFLVWKFRLFSFNYVSSLGKQANNWAQFPSKLPMLSPWTLHKKWSFPLRISSVNVTKSAGNFFFDCFYEEKCERKQLILGNDFLAS